MHQDTNQISGQSAEARNVNANVSYPVLLVFTVVRQVMVELSGAATEEEKSGAAP